MPYIRKHLTLSLFCGLSLAVFGQSFGNFPSSVNGIGRMEYTGNAQQLGMSGTGMGLRAEQSINLLNPASLSDNRNTRLEAGFHGFTVWNKQPGKSASNRTLGGDLGYIALNIPLWSKIGWTTGLALMPYSKMSFDFSSTNTDIYSRETRSMGFGGLSRLYNAHAFKLFKGMNMAVGGAYVYGQLIQDVRSYYPDTLNTYNFWSKNTWYLQGFTVDGSLQYEMQLGKKDTTSKQRPHGLTLGLKYEYTLPMQSTLEYEQYSFSRVKTGSTGAEVFYDVVTDTLAYSEGKARDIKLGNTLDAGLSFRYRQSWILGADFQYRDLSGADLPFRNFTSSAWTARMGAQWLGKPDGNKGYLEKVQWRLGFRYGQLPFQGTTGVATQWGISIGAGLPMEKTFRRAPMNWMNLSLDYSQLNWPGYNQEQLIRLTLGITLQDRWFNKIKID